MEKRRVRLNINGVVCGLITGESAEYMQALADEVGALMKQIMDSSPLITREAAALTAALSICDDCHKNADRAAALQERMDKLEVEAEIWQEEKVELLKASLDTQKDAQLAEKAARLESENARLEESVRRLRDVARQAQSLEDENAALREAAKNPGPSAKETALAAEIQDLTSQLNLATRNAGAALEESRRLQAEVDSLSQAVKRSEDALRAAQSSAPTPDPIRPLGAAPKRSRNNPLRRQESLDQQGMVSFFEKDEK